MDTREAIRRAFLRLYEAKDFQNITVTELCAAVPVARTTFYAYYRNTDDVREEIEDGLIAGLMETAERVSGGDFPDMDVGAFIRATTGYVKSRRAEFYALLAAQPDRRFEEKFKGAVKRHLSLRYPGKSSAPNYGLTTEMIASAALGAYCFWLMHPEEVREDDLERLTRVTLDGLMGTIA